MLWPDGSSGAALRGVARLERGQDHLAVLELGVGVVGALDVRAQVAGELDDATGGLEHGVARRSWRRRDRGGP